MTYPHDSLSSGHICTTHCYLNYKSLATVTLIISFIYTIADGVCYCHCCQNTYSNYCSSYVAGSFSGSSSDCTMYQCYLKYSACPYTSSTGYNNPEYEPYTSTGTIVGSVIGSLLFIGCIVAIIIGCRYRQQQQLLIVGGAVAGNPYTGLNNNVPQQQPGYYQQQQPGYYQPPPMGQQQQQQPYPVVQGTPAATPVAAPVPAGNNNNVPRI